VKRDETLALDVFLNGGDNVSTTFGGTAPLKIWEGKKTCKNRCDLRQLSSLSANVKYFWKQWR